MHISWVFRERHDLGNVPVGKPRFQGRCLEQSVLLKSYRAHLSDWLVSEHTPRHELQLWKLDGLLGQNYEYSDHSISQEL